MRAAPDGYTLLHCAPTTLIATPLLLKNPPYDTLKDFTYISHMADATTSMPSLRTVARSRKPKL